MDSLLLVLVSPAGLVVVAVVCILVYMFRHANRDVTEERRADMEKWYQGHAEVRQAAMTRQKQALSGEWHESHEEKRRVAGEL